MAVRRRTRVRLRAALALLGLTLPLAACSGASGSQLVVSQTSCATGWKPAAGGTQQVSVYNSGGMGLRVEVVAAGGTGVFAQVDTLAPGATRTLQLDLPNGSYTWVCTPLEEGFAPATSAARSVRGSTSTATPVYPLTATEQRQISRAYAMRVVLRMAALLPAATALQAALQAGDLAAARTQWLRAHLQLEELGGLYGSTGPPSWSRLDGLPGGLPAGVHDPAFTGFHRVEYLLWHHGSRADLLSAGKTLLADLTTLQARVGAGPLQVGVLVAQVQEILERSARQELTGASDAGSGSGLATVAADVAGTQLLLGALVPALQPRDPKLLGSVQSALAALAAQLSGLRRADGSWPPPQQLDQTAGEHLQLSLAGVLDQLAEIPAVLMIHESSPD